MPFHGRSDAPIIRTAMSALEALLARYCRLVNSGDCGFWDPEEEEEVRHARAAITKLEERLLRE